ncbi:hypothetical protein AMTR_s00096p00097930 [Amborella trichopoda]|uniref:Uncharacterized protein n=1 Tax=Amborella trichopoda TaxID=13333 RepID=W1P5Z0_AMBTC|nr:hypothetical protein AMTR_s00096p00097930 [Amborella trichopoda]
MRDKRETFFNPSPKEGEKKETVEDQPKPKDYHRVPLPDKLKERPRLIIADFAPLKEPLSLLFERLLREGVIEKPEPRPTGREYPGKYCA